MNFESITYQELLSEIEEFYNKVGPKYEFIYPNFRESNRILAKSILDKISLPENARIADLGCGSGWLLNELAELAPRARLFGFDISQESIEFAKLNFNAVHPEISFQKCDWMNIRNIISEKFDLLICVGNTLTHFPEEIQKAIVTEFSFLLNEKGSAVIDSYNGWNEKLNDVILFEPKGLTKNENEAVFSCIFSSYQKKVAIRNICFAHYAIEGIKEPKPQQYEQYVTYQFTFTLSQSIQLNDLGFSSLNEINLTDAINIFKYYQLLK